MTRTSVPRRRSISVLLLLFALALLGPGARLGVRNANAQAPIAPNIVLILTDDQRADSLPRMPRVDRLLTTRGMRLSQAVVSNPVCCPSRTTILTGRYSHSTSVWTSGTPEGGWQRFNAAGWESHTIATALDQAGYRTGLIGKYLNGYRYAGEYVPPGWDRWFATVSPGAYYDYRVYDDRAGFVDFGSDPTDYLTDVLKRKAKSFVRGTAADTPLFLMVTPFAPHGPAIPAPRHEGDLSGAEVTFAPSFNERDVSDKPAYLRERGRVDPARAASTTIAQWESLLAVDELVRALAVTLERTGRLENTVFIYTSDNGFSNWEHRWRGKQVPYDESIRVPFVVRADGLVPQGTVSGALASNLDIAPTIADFASIEFPGADGVSLRPLLTDAASSARTSVALEFVSPDTQVPTYCGVRLRSFLFTHYATGEEELYDLGVDPWQLENVVEERPEKANELRNLAASLCQPPPPGFSW